MTREELLWALTELQDEDLESLVEEALTNRGISHLVWTPRTVLGVGLEELAWGLEEEECHDLLEEIPKTAEYRNILMPADQHFQEAEEVVKAALKAVLRKNKR